MKRVLIFSTAYFPFVGGAEIAVKEITDRISDKQFDMITARMDRKLPTKERIGNINVYRIGIGQKRFDKLFLAFFGAKIAQQLIEENKYDYFWSIMASFGGFAALAAKKKNPHIPFLLTLQEGDDPQYIKKRVGVFYNKFLEIFKKADYIQCISNFLSNWAKENGATCPIKVIPNGVNLKLFNNSPFLKGGRGDFLKTELGIKENDKVIITASRLVKKNGVGDLIKAIAELKNKNIILLIAGSGELEAELKDLTKQLDIQSQVIFLGQLSHEELPQYLAISDIFTRPSLSEGLGNSFLEAMAMGVPVIGTNVGGIPDFLKDRKTGLFCEINNPKSLADSINLLLNDEALRKNIIENGKKLVYEKYNWDTIAKDMEDVFNFLAS